MLIQIDPFAIQTVEMAGFQYILEFDGSGSERLIEIAFLTFMSWADFIESDWTVLEPWDWLWIN